MFELVGVVAGRVVFLAETAGSIQFAVRVEGLVVVGADLAPRVRLHAAVGHAGAAPGTSARIHHALATCAAVELIKHREQRRGFVYRLGLNISG